MDDILRPFISKSIEKNNAKVLQNLKQYITELDFFKNILKKFPNIDYLSCINILTNLIFFQYFENQFILKKGDKIKGIYIIFTGEVTIYNEVNNEDNKVEEQSYKRRKNIYNNINKINLVPSFILYPGYSIGDFLDKEENLSQKIVQASLETIIGYIKYDRYRKVMQELNYLESGHIIPFIKGLNLFGSMNNFIEKLNLYTIQRKYQKDSYIFKEGDNFKTFYIIKSGIINISIKIKSKTKSLIEPELLTGNSYKTQSTSGQKEHELKGYYTETLDYHLVNFCRGEIIGDIEYYKHYPFYLYTAKCITPVDILEINSKKFKYLANKCGENLSKFYNKIESKIQYFKKRIKEINSTHKKVNKDASKKDIFTKLYLENNNIKENEKINIYINSPKNPTGTVIKKYNSFKMICNLNNVKANYTSLLESKNRCFSSKDSIFRKKNNFVLDTFKKIPAKNSRYKILKNIHFNKIEKYLINKRKIIDSNKLLIKSTDKTNTNSYKYSLPRRETYELKKISKDINELTSFNQQKKKKIINVFYQNYKSEQESRDKVLFNKKLKHIFLMKNLNSQNSKIYKKKSYSYNKSWK